MAISNEECISILQCELCRLESIESYHLEDDDDFPQEDLRELEKEMEAYRRAICALEKTSRKKGKA